MIVRVLMKCTQVANWRVRELGSRKSRPEAFQAFTQEHRATKRLDQIPVFCSSPRFFHDTSPIRLQFVHYAGFI
jgi:hypothetical protein